MKADLLERLEKEIHVWLCMPDSINDPVRLSGYLSLLSGEERERLQHVIDATGVGTWQWNVQTDEARVDEQWAAMLGFTPDELGEIRFDTFDNALHPDDRAHAKASLQHHLEGKTDNYDCEVRMRHKAGHWIWVQSRGKVMERSASGQPLWM